MFTLIASQVFSPVEIIWYHNTLHSRGIGGGGGGDGGGGLGEGVTTVSLNVFFDEGGG
jgi:hypothetical protein